jgi:hypothetical protein
VGDEDAPLALLTRRPSGGSCEPLVAHVDEAHRAAELRRLTADAKTIDDQLADPSAEGERVSHRERERRRYSELRDRSAAAWRWVHNRAMTLKSSADNLR